MHSLLSAYRLSSHTAVRLLLAFLAQCNYTLFSLLRLSKPHFLAQCIQALHIRCTPCWYNYAFIHQSRTSLLSAYRLFTYAVPPCWYNYAFYIKAALPCSVHTGYSHTLYLLAGTIMRFTSKPHFLAQCLQALHIRCTSLLVQLCVLHQSRTSLLIAYRLFTYAVPPCWYNYAFYILAALPCSVHTGSPHTLYLLAGTIMRSYIKAALPCSVHTGSSHTLYFLASIIIRLHINQSCISLLSAFSLFTYAVLPC